MPFFSLRQALPEGASSVREADSRMKNKRYLLKNLCWLLVLAVGAGFMVYGCAPEFAREEWETVLEKAVNICFQCIGLG